MMLSITNRRAPATDLGYLLHKNPARLQQVDIAAGKAYVFYPCATDDCCTAVLMLDLDPVALVRELGGPKGEDAKLAQYVNDRPYVASSFLSVAMARAFSTAMKGQSRERPELISQPLPLTAELSVVRSTQGEPLLRELFEPLGYRVEVQPYPLDSQFPEWGESEYFSLRIEGEVTLQALLSHLYVLIPVLDDDKHYWVSRDEVDKLLRAGEGWLKEHPARETISRRYLRHQRRFVNEALERLTAEDEPELEEKEAAKEADEASLESKLNLNEQRIEAVMRRVETAAPSRAIDLGCGEGKLLQRLLQLRSIAAVSGMDVSAMQLVRTARRLQVDRMPEFDRKRLTLFQGSLVYRDDRLKGYDVATMTEVIEHMDAPRLAAFERVVFEYARPRTLILTTPNAEYNAVFEKMPAGAFRHRDHRFEWNRQQFGDWASRIAERHGYRCAIEGIGDLHPAFGPPTQMAIFTEGEE
ncbi:MAG: 3' terminal RNA ribose 2'-O-methyltransferase Hen1 [FCB group bacterium]|jgi:3' terminal RNA ribose 2'-O-methyltransferase Hen1|nr:3' terminal RNA ribose 2'-O-methyltransferase Hen1 [FCB group bacterium]